MPQVTKPLLNATRMGTSPASKHTYYYDSQEVFTNGLALPDKTAPRRGDIHKFVRDFFRKLL